VPVPALPKLGRTWYERGAPYWLCRVRTTVFIVLVMGLFGLFAMGLYEGFREELPSAVRGVWDAGQVVGACGALVWGWVKQRRGHREALLNPPTPEETLQAKRDHDRRVPGRIGLGRGLVILAAPVMPAFAAYIVGWLAAWVTVREYPSEVGARRWLEEHRSGA
jgi:phage-related protein